MVRVRDARGPGGRGIYMGMRGAGGRAAGRGGGLALGRWLLACCLLGRWGYGPIPGLALICGPCRAGLWA